MAIALIPISQTTLNWEHFLSVTHAALKRSMAAPLDKKSVTDRGMASAIASFGEFQAEHTDYTSVLRDAGSLLRHFSMSFLVMCDDEQLILEIATEGDLKILLCEENNKLCIMTASLEGWRNTLINFATHRSTVVQRNFAGELLKSFDKLGLSRLWENFSRTSDKNGLILREK